MSKLVDSPVTIRPFLPNLLPGLIKVEGTVGNVDKYMSALSGSNGLKDYGP